MASAVNTKVAAAPIAMNMGGTYCDGLDTVVFGTVHRRQSIFRVGAGN